MDQDTTQTPTNRTQLTILIFVITITAGWLFHLLTDQNIPFDSQAWKNTSLIHESETRHKMVRDLQNNVLKPGMTRLDLESLLGKDDSVLLTNNTSSYELIYSLGAGPGTSYTDRYGRSYTHPGPSQSLVLTLNHQDQLSDWRVMLTH
jgi:hypothetical protein